MVFQGIAPRTFEVSTLASNCDYTTTSYAHWGIGRSWGTSVASTDAWVSSSPFAIMYICSPRPVRTMEWFSVRWPLWQWDQRTSCPNVSAGEVGTRSIISLVSISIVRTPIVYHYSHAYNCENTSTKEWGNFLSTNLGNSWSHENNWLPGTNLDHLRLWSYWRN